jgi:protein TonB
VAPEASQVLPPAAPPRSGLSLGGASQELGPPPAPGAPSGGSTRPARPSLRDQIASLGSGEWAEGQGSAKQTIDLDNREPHYVDYLALLKRRIERVWGYPPEAANHGISGDLLLIFTLNKSGSLIDLHLIRSSGFPVLDEAAIRAVKLAAPYDPFPAYMGTDPWNIRASFTYYLPYGFRR